MTIKFFVIPLNRRKKTWNYDNENFKNVISTQFVDSERFHLQHSHGRSNLVNVATSFSFLIMSEDVDGHVLRRFELCQKLGKGAYGIVWKAIEKRSRSVIALKKCFDAFRNATDAQRTFREIMYLQALSGHDNLIRMQHVIKAEVSRKFKLGLIGMTKNLQKCMFVMVSNRKISISAR